MYKIKQIPKDFIVDEIPLFNIKSIGEYSYFVLEKENYDTEKIIQILSVKFKISRNRFSYAGNKDKNAITKQYFSVKGQIPEITKKNYNINKVGFGNKPISLGDLKGNKFRITVRNIEKTPLLKNSFVNYFGEQRFGKNNLEIGFAILKKKFKSAATLIDYPKTKSHLKQNPNDHIGAIRKVPFKILKLYLHSVQSYLWNEIAAQYVKSETNNYLKVKYRHGEYIFADVKNVEIPLIAFDSDFNDSKIEKLYLDILSKNAITLRDFVVREISSITPHGSQRNVVARISNLRTGNLEKDELNFGKKKILISFELGRGSYATVALNRLFLNVSNSNF